MAVGFISATLTLLCFLNSGLSSHAPIPVDLISNLIKLCIDTAVEQINSERMNGHGGHSSGMSGHGQHPNAHSEGHGHTSNAHSGMHGHGTKHSGHGSHAKGHMNHMEDGHSHEHVRILDDNAQLIRRTQEIFNKLTGTWPTVLLKEESLLNEWRKHIAPHCEILEPKLTCDPTARYRKADGTCNNLANPMWASTMIPQERFLPPVYSDEFNNPRTTTTKGKPLPSTRLISNIVHSNTGKSPVPSKKTTNMFMAYGQFIDHDILHTPVLKDKNKKDLKCCPLGNQDDHCFPIPVPADDPMFNGLCMSFVRSAATPYLNCDPGPRAQMNHPTSYLDGSVVYGSNKIHQDSLRVMKHGRLKLSKNGMLHAAPDDECILSSPGHHCFKSGDGRRHITPTITCLHLLFVNEHNYIADTLRTLNPNWDDERLFQEAKRIVVGELQHIAFSEYLPLVIGDAHMEQYGLYPTIRGYSNVYDPHVDASTRNGFGAAAFRFGHSEIPNVLALMAKNHSVIRAIPLHTQFNRPDLFFSKNGDENLMRWMANSYHEKNDRLLQDSVRNFLFLNDKGESFDLAAINIQRGRDHGLPPYNVWRKWCGLAPILHFGDGFGGLIHHEPAARKLIEQVYSHPDDIDLYTGGLSESKIEDGAVGPTFACLIARQFKKYKTGDRFWYETDHRHIRFTEDQLNEIKKTTLSSVLCRNAGIRVIQPSVFRAPDRMSNYQVLCDQVPGIDISYWKDQGGFDQRNPFITPPLNPLSFLNPLQNPNPKMFKKTFNSIIKDLRARHNFQQ